MFIPIQIQPRKPVRGEVMRVANGLTRAALANLAGEGPPSEVDVHEARKTLKRLRALARLVRGAIAETEFRIADRAFRDAKNALGGLRDARVRLDALEELRASGDATSAKLEAQTAEVRESLQSKFRETATRHADDGPRMEEVRRALKDQRERIELWDLPNGFGAFRRGLERTYRGGTAALAVFLREPTVHNGHELRKRVKDLMYHVEMLERGWKRPLAAYRKELDTLSDWLGGDHDLAVLEESIGDLRAPDLASAIHRRADRLRSRALHLGVKVYARKPKAFVREIAVAWEIERGR